MEQDVDSGYRSVCSTCLSSDRDLFSLNNTIPQAFQIFKLLMYDFAGDRLGEMPEISHLICWECLAMMKRFYKFKWQVHNAQEHIRVLALSLAQETMDHTYISQSLSSLVVETKADYDKIFFNYSTVPDCQYIMSNPITVKNEQFLNQKDPITIDTEEHILDVPDMVLDNSNSHVYTHVVLDPSTLVTSGLTLPTLTIAPMTSTNIEAGTVIMSAQPESKVDETEVKPSPVFNQYVVETNHLTTSAIPSAVGASAVMSKPAVKKEELDKKLGYITEYMSEADMLASREEAKKKVQYASSVYKCELCVIGFYTQQQVQDHFETAHKPRPTSIKETTCKICYLYIERESQKAHLQQHYLRFTCKMCSHVEYSERLMQIHAESHLAKPVPNAVIKIEGNAPPKKSKKRKQKAVASVPPKPGDLRKLLSKTTIEGYKCLECDMFFKNSRARKNHVARFHREGLQCDHCQKRFVNRTTLTTHLRLHEGPLPREECPVCHKLVRSIQIKYHIQRHQSKSRYECADCDKIFSHLATYHAHLKYSRAHAGDSVLKFPCPMCNKGYPTKETMQDHFNYQHLGKTSHKCPVCDKPIASRANVEKHISRVHGEKKQRPRNHQCQTCGKSFTDKKALTQHEVIHSGLRPLSCDICHQTFKQKASLYTHRKRVHKVYPDKKVVHYMDELPA